MQTIVRTIFILFVVIVSNNLAAQGINMPDTPSQAPIGGIGWLAVLGGAMAYK